MTDKLIMKYRFLRVLYFFIICIRLILFLIADQIMNQFVLPFLSDTLSLSPNRFSLRLHYETFRSVVPTLYRFWQKPLNTDGTIQTMSNTYKDISRLIILLLQIRLYRFRQRSITGFIPLNNLRRSLIDYDYMIIFVKRLSCKDYIFIPPST